jgi:hypothetical protein
MTTAMGNGKLVRMRSVLGEFAALKAGQGKIRRKGMAEFLEQFEKQHFVSLTTGRVEFNLFEALRVADYEIRHSAFLAWLLDAGAEHKQGTAFLKRFLNACGIEHDLGATTLPVVQTEYRERRAFIDVMVYVRGELLVYIENKVGGQENKRQLISEFRDMRELGLKLRVPENRQYAVFLTPQGDKPKTNESSHWHRLSYGKLADSFATVLPDSASEKLQFVVADWIAIARKIGGVR